MVCSYFTKKGGNMLARKAIGIFKKIQGNLDINEQI